MDIFEQQEMSKSRPQVKNKLDDWYDWLINHVLKTVKDRAKKKTIINPHNINEECVKWAVIAAENVGMKDPQRVSNLSKFTDNYDWSGLKFPVAIKNIKDFEMNNNGILRVIGRE